MTIDPPKSWIVHWWKYVAITFGIVVVVLLDFMDVIARIAPGFVKPDFLLEDVRVNRIALVVLLAAPAAAAIFLYLGLLRERDKYFRQLQSHYGDKEVLHQLKHYGREGQSIRSRLPVSNRDKSQELERIRTWIAEYEKWRNQTDDYLCEYCTPTEVAEFNEIDQSITGTTSDSPFLAVRNRLGHLDQYRNKLCAIIEQRESHLQ